MKPCNNGWKNVLCLKKGHSQLFWNHANLVYLKYSCLLKPLHPSVCLSFHNYAPDMIFTAVDITDATQEDRFSVKMFTWNTLKCTFFLFLKESLRMSSLCVCVYLCECALCLCECVFSFSVHFLRKSMFMIYVSWLLWILFIIKFYYEKNEKIVYR